MKKVILIALLTIISVLLIACNNNSDKNHIKVSDDTMIIQQSKFSDETQEVLQIIDNEIAFFDYEVDESIKSISMEVWAYKDGQWINSGGTHGDINPGKKRIAIRLNQNSGDIFEIDEKGYTKYTYDNIVDFSECTMQTYFRLTNPTNIEINKEITLWANLGTSKNALSSSENFREVDCDAGIAVTITFSDKNID